MSVHGQITSRFLCFVYFYSISGSKLSASAYYNARFYVISNLVRLCILSLLGSAPAKVFQKKKTMQVPYHKSTSSVSYRLPRHRPRAARVSQWTTGLLVYSCRVIRVKLRRTFLHVAHLLSLFITDDSACMQLLRRHPSSPCYKMLAHAEPVVIIRSNRYYTYTTHTHASATKPASHALCTTGRRWRAPFSQQCCR
jgi:hypothetical protein